MMNKNIRKWALIMLLPVLAISCDESSTEPTGNLEPPESESGIRLCYISYMRTTEYEFDGSRRSSNIEITYDDKNVSDVDFVWNDFVYDSVRYTYSPGVVIGHRRVSSHLSEKYEYGFEDSVLLYRSVSRKSDDDDTYYHGYTYNFEYDDSGFLSAIAFVQGGPPWDEVFQITWDESHKNIIAMKSPKKELYFTYDNKLNPFVGRPSADYYYLSLGNGTLSSILLPFNKNNITKISWVTELSSVGWIDQEYTYDKGNRPLAMMAKYKWSSELGAWSILAESTFKYQD
jgi:hypothetical protein